MRQFLLLSVFFVFTGGCATVTTLMWPSVENEYLGKKRIIDEGAGYNYKLDINDRVLSLKGEPFCREKAPKYKITKKQHRGIVFIIIETPVWGLGLADWALSYMVSKNSEQKELIEYVPTGIKRKCGDNIIPAKGRIMIQNSHSGEIHWAELDKNGNFSLFPVIGDYRGTRPFNLFFNIENENKYLTTVWW